VRTYQVASLTAGSHSLYIGSVSDGNYYSVPWCRIQVQHTPLPAFTGFDLNGWNALTSAYRTSTFGTPPVQYGTQASSCAGNSMDESGNVYTFNLPTTSAYDVIVTWGDSAFSDKSYVQWDQKPSTTSFLTAVEGSNTLSSATGAGTGGGDKNQVRTYQVASLTAGSHSLYIGSVSDGNYYSVPWCRIQVQFTPAG